MSTICTRFDICSSGKLKSGEEYPNRDAQFGLNNAYIMYMKFQTPNSPYTDNALFCASYLYGKQRKSKLGKT